MSNKLYTEEQVRKAIEYARVNNFGSDFERWLENSEDTIMNGLTPIELPTDEEIERLSFGDGTHDFYIGGFVEGAKWMRDKIQGGNNEQ